MITRILVALDETPIAPRVLAVATEVAERFDADLFLFRALLVPPEFPPAAYHGSTEDPLSSHLAEAAARSLRDLAAGKPRALVHPPVIGRGDPWVAITEASERLAVDLVVTGSHLYHWPDRVLGTVAGNLVNRGHCDVLVVRP